MGISSSTGGDEIAAHIGHLVDLQSLTFYESNLTDQGLRQLSRLVNLRDLSLHGSKITAGGLASLEGMSQLKNLYIETGQYLDRCTPLNGLAESRACRDWRSKKAAFAMSTLLRYRP